MKRTIKALATNLKNIRSVSQRAVIMKRLFLSLFLLPCACHAMDDVLITMPDEATLTQRLNALGGLSDFAAKTNIVSELAGEEKYPLGVVNALNDAMGVYLKKTGSCLPLQQKQDYEKTVTMRRPALLQALLRDHPQALKSLQELGQYNADEAGKN